MMTICRLLGSATPKALPMAGKAGSMMSMESAVSAIISAVSAMNSTCDMTSRGESPGARSSARPRTACEPSPASGREAPGFRVVMDLCTWWTFARALARSAGHKLFSAAGRRLILFTMHSGAKWALAAAGAMAAGGG